MTPEDQSLTGQQVFDLTVAQAVTDGELGNLTVVECTNCNPPEGNTVKRLKGEVTLGYPWFFGTVQKYINQKVVALFRYRRASGVNIMSKQEE